MISKVKIEQIKSLLYLILLSAVLVFSLYGLFAEDAKAWFSSNRNVYVNPLYGRALTSGAGRNLASFKNGNDIFGDGDITVGNDETPALIMVPGDVIHFVFLISVDNPSDLSNSTLLLQGLAGDMSIRGDCSIAAGQIRIFTVTVSQTGGDAPKIEYRREGTGITINNSAVPSLVTENDYMEITVGETEIEIGEAAEVGPYAGKYVYLLDIPIFYRDTGENQNNHKYIPSSDPETAPEYGWILIERCVFIINEP